MSPIKSSFFSAGVLRNILFLLLVLHLMPLYCGQTVLHCSQCNERIRPGASYIRYQSKIFCSRQCQMKVMPRCTQCQQPISPGKQYFVSRNKPYCSKNCLSRIMPECTVCSRRSFNGGIYAGDHSYFACPDCMKLPRCFACTIPVRGGKRLSDGRMICRKCLKTSVSDLNTALRIFHNVRKSLRTHLQISSNHRINFSLVNQKTLQRLSANIVTAGTPRRNSQIPVSPEQGLFRFDGIIREYSRNNVFRSRRKVRREVTDAKYSIYILDHLPLERMEYVMAHELAHDYLSAHFPGIRTPWIQEGFAEYVGFLYNRHRRRDHLNIRLEKNPDPVYGDGFRKIRSIAERNGWDGLKRFLRSQQKHRIK